MYLLHWEQSGGTIKSQEHEELGLPVLKSPRWFSKAVSVPDLHPAGPAQSLLSTLGETHILSVPYLHRPFISRVNATKHYECAPRARHREDPALLLPAPASLLNEGHGVHPSSVSSSVKPEWCSFPHGASRVKQHRLGKVCSSCLCPSGIQLVVVVFNVIPAIVLHSKLSRTCPARPHSAQIREILLFQTL